MKLAAKRPWLQFLGFSLSLPLLMSLQACGSADSSASQLANIGDAASLQGTWAKQMVLSSESAAAGVRSKNKVVRVSLMKITEQDGKLLAEERACDVQTLNSGATTINFPPSLLPLLDRRSYTYQLSPNAEALELKGAVEVLGARLQDPLRDALPERASDPRVLDQDGDGQPGVTVNVQARVVISIEAALYVSQRTFWNETLTQVDGRADRLSGRVDWRQEQFTLGSSNPLFTTVKPTVTTLPAESSVTLQKVDANLDCAGLKRQLGSLLPRVPAP